MSGTRENISSMTEKSFIAKTEKTLPSVGLSDWAPLSGVIEAAYQNSMTEKQDNRKRNPVKKGVAVIKQKESADSPKNNFHAKIPIVVVLPGLTGGSTSNYIR